MSRTLRAQIGLLIGASVALLAVAEQLYPDGKPGKGPQSPGGGAPGGTGPTQPQGGRVPAHGPGDPGDGSGPTDIEPPFPWPTSDQRIDYVWAMSQYAIGGLGDWPGDLPETWAGSPLVPIVAVDRLMLDPDTWQSWYDAIKDSIRQQSPFALTGTYLSAGDCRWSDDMTDFPQEMIAYEAMRATDFVKPYDAKEARAFVNLASPNTARRFADLIVDELVRRGEPIAYLDNVRRNVFWANWLETTDFLGDIRRRVNAAGIRTILNCAILPYVLAGDNADLLGDAADGLSFEMAFHPVWCRGYAENFLTEVQVLRRWMSRGVHIQILSSPSMYPDPGFRTEQERIFAALVMLIRRPGDSIFVSTPSFDERPDWGDWPTHFGAALGDFEVLSTRPLVVQRRFAEGTLVVDVTAGINPSTSGASVHFSRW
jgi:hypothetical protein